MYDDDKTRKIYTQVVPDNSSNNNNYFGNASQLSRIRRVNGMGYLMIIAGILVLLWAFKGE